MKFQKSHKIHLYLYLFLFLFLAVLIVINPEIGKNAAKKGILLCGNVIIPSLFAFSALILFLMKIIPLLISGKEKIFIIIFSLVGGYPIGAKLINNALKKNILNQNEAKKMLNYCVNAGPAFIIGAVGGGILSSKKIGYILFFSHVSASLFIWLIYGFKTKDTTTAINKNINFSFADSFTESVTDSADMMLGICGYVIFFSVLNDYLIYFSEYLSFFKYITFFLEVTQGIIQTKNIFFISFLLGFSGLCIWCQILKIGKEIKLNIFSFAFFRILHGFSSTLITVLIFKIFKISFTCFSNSANFNSHIFYSSPIFSLSLLSLGIIFIISLFSKKYSRNLIDDML